MIGNHYKPSGAQLSILRHSGEFYQVSLHPPASDTRRSIPRNALHFLCSRRIDLIDLNMHLMCIRSLDRIEPVVGSSACFRWPQKGLQNSPFGGPQKCYSNYVSVYTVLTLSPQHVFNVLHTLNMQSIHR